MELFVGGLWGWFSESWRLLGTFLGILGGLWASFLVPGQLLGALFLVLESPWGTLWYQMAPRTDFLEFWMRFGIHFGRLLGSRVGFGSSFGSLLVPIRASTTIKSHRRAIKLHGFRFSASDSILDSSRVRKRSQKHFEKPFQFSPFLGLFCYRFGGIFPTSFSEPFGEGF